MTDFLIPQGNKRLLMVEAKSSRAVALSESDSLNSLAASIKNNIVTKIVVYRPAPKDPTFATLSPRVKALSLQQALTTFKR